MANAVTQSWAKPVLVMNGVAQAKWNTGDGEQSIDVQLSYEQLVRLAEVIDRTGYNWPVDKANDDSTLAVINLGEHYMSYSDIVSALSDVKIDGMPVEARPNSWDYKALAIRDAVLTLGVEHLFAESDVKAATKAAV